MWGHGVFSSIIRFICHIPTGMIGINGLTYYNRVKGLGDIYDVIPSGGSLLKGMAIVGIGGLVTFIWNFIMFAASPFCGGPLLGLIGMVDLVLAVLLIVGVAMQSRFLPGTYGPCNMAADWKNSTDGRNFFVVAHGTEGFSGTGPGDICHNLVMSWIVAIVVIVFYLICAIANILIGLDGATSGGPGTRRSFGHLTEYDISWCPRLFRPLLLALMRGPVFHAYRYLHGSATISHRYISKYWKRNRDRTRFKTTQFKRGGAGGSASEKAVPTPPRLPMELVKKIAKDLHYADLINISRSSKYMRLVFFADRKPQQVAEELRPFVCWGKFSRINCTICRIQTCPDCRHQKIVPRSKNLRHMTGCRPTCSRCFFKNHCVRPSQPTDTDRYLRYYRESPLARLRRMSRRKKMPALSGGRRDVEMGAGGTAAGDAYSPICENCEKMSEDEMLAVLDQENVREVQRLGRMPLACSTCKQQLPDGGVRWWVDSETEKECKWDGHPAWV
ncbi:hypothetical protein VTI74DRAFT_6813 [Chaetomium olivicolor]